MYSTILCCTGDTYAGMVMLSVYVRGICTRYMYEVGLSFVSVVENVNVCRQLTWLQLPVCSTSTVVVYHDCVCATAIDLTFHIQGGTAGSWSQLLCTHIATHTANTLKDSNKTGGLTSVCIQGPYGNLALDLSSYEVVCIFAGGIGITPMLPILSHLHDHMEAYPMLQRVCVCWSVRGNLAHSVFLPQLLQHFKDIGEGVHSQVPYCCRTWLYIDWMAHMGLHTKPLVHVTVILL